MPKRGFAAMDPDRQRRLAAKGAAIAQERGTAHRWSREQAVAMAERARQARAKKRG